MSARSELMRGVLSFSAMSVYGAAIVCCLCWLLLLNLYDAENLRLGGRSVLLSEVDAYGKASVLGERLKDVPGKGPLVFYAGSSLAGNALSSPEHFQRALRREMGDVDLRAITVGGLSLWEIEALAANLDPSRERILLLPVNISRFEAAKKKLNSVVRAKRLIFSDSAHWRKILAEEGAGNPSSLGFMVLDNFGYVARRKKGLVQQFWMPPAKMSGWHGKIPPGEKEELEKMWSDPTYVPEGKTLRDGLKNVVSIAGARVMAGWNGEFRIRDYSNNGDIAERMLVRSIKRLQEKNIKVVMFETPIDVEAMTLLRGEEKTSTLLKDIYARIKRVGEKTASPALFTGRQLHFPTVKFSDWVHIEDEEARKKFTRTLAKGLADWYRQSTVEGSR